MKKINKIIIFLTIILLFCFSISVSAIISDPSTFYECSTGLATARFNTTKAMDFDQIVIAANYLQFNYTGFNITSTNNIYIQIEHVNTSLTSAPPGRSLVRFYANGTLPNVIRYNISGFVPGAVYNVYQDGVLYVTQTSGAAGNVSFTSVTVAKEHYNITRLSSSTNTTSLLRVTYKTSNPNIINLTSTVLVVLLVATIIGLLFYVVYMYYYKGE